ncbi:hypothetical protein [Micromonospora sp. NPDC048898]|uniref:hypothetical protein n=1 Tax=Micromonospora sp. NPDC048898 TaxID=3364260 RepID=UPI0037166E28
MRMSLDVPGVLSHTLMPVWRNPRDTTPSTTMPFDAVMIRPLYQYAAVLSTRLSPSTFSRWQSWIWSTPRT